ncbi:MAG: hypothetical protein WAN32_03235, partial [Candidatus Acidiferrum sp.]
MRARQEFSLFVRTAIHRVSEKITPDTTEIEKRIALAWSAISHNCFPGTLCLDQKIEEGTFGFIHLLRKRMIAFKTGEPSRFFSLAKFINSDAYFLRMILRMASINPKRSAMRTELFDIEKCQPVRRKDLLDSQKGEIT